MALSEGDLLLVRAAQSAHEAATQIARKQQASSDAVEQVRRPVSAPVTALVSWAHSDEGWSDAETAKWTSEVVEFAAALRANGIDADLDLFHSHEPDIDWTRFGPAAVDSSQFVIVAMSRAWAQRWSGSNSPNRGAGAAAEADALKGLFQRDQSAWQRKVVVAVLPSQSEDQIPTDLMRATRFWVDPRDPDSLDTLLRTLTGQPLYAKPGLGGVPVLPPAVAASLGVNRDAGRSADDAEFKDYSAVLRAVKKAPRSQTTSDRMALLVGLLDALSS